MGKESKESKLKQMFSSLRYRNFRLLWMGVVISTTGDFIELVALNWLVYELTGSAFYLGMFNLARALPVLFFTLIAGTLADKYERRKLMIYSQGTAMLLSSILAFLAFTNRINVYNLISIGILQGVANSFNLPIRQSLIPELVPREKIANAVALNGAFFNLTLVLGPALGGIIIASLGVPWALLINALSFIAVLWALFAMRIPKVEKKHDKTLFESMKEGIKYIINHRTIRTILGFYFFMIAIGMPYNTLLPVFAKDYFRLGASGYGYLFAVGSLGGLLGSLAAGMRNKEKVKKATTYAFICFGSLLILFGVAALFTNYIFLFILLLVLIGFSLTTFYISNNTSIQLLVEDKYRGRVVSTIFLGLGLTSVGNFFIGTLAELFSAPVAYIIIGSILFLASLFFMYLTRESVFHD